MYLLLFPSLLSLSLYIEWLTNDLFDVIIFLTYIPCLSISLFPTVSRLSEHAILAYGAGVRNVIVAVNKMDSINYSQERYDFIVSKITEMLTSIGFSKPQFVPVSAKDNVNISPSGTKAVSKALGKASTTPGAGELEPSVAALLPWFKGPSLVDLIDKLPPDVVDVTTPFTMAIHEVFVNPVFGLTIAGKVLTGACVVKERIALYPSGYVSPCI